MSIKTIIEDVHRLVNKERRRKGKKPIVFDDRSDYLENFFNIGPAVNINYRMKIMEPLPETVAVENAPYCQCPSCQGALSSGDTANVKRVKRNAAIGKWNTYARGHRPGKVSLNNSLGDDIYDFEVKVMDEKEYQAKDAVNQRIITLLKQVENGGEKEITCVYIAPEKKTILLRQIKKAMKIMNFKVNFTTKKDHIALQKA